MVDAITVRETIIRPKLAEVFGNTLATALIMSAMVAGMGGRSEQEKLKLMVDAICSNQKVISMWGVSQAQRQKREWASLL